MNVFTKSRWLRWVVLVGVIIASIIAFMKFEHAPRRRAEKIAGMDIPVSRLIALKDEWSDFLGEGQSLFVFEVPADFAAATKARCADMSFTDGRLADSSVRVPQAEKYVDVNEQACYQIQASATDFRAVILSGRTLVVTHGTL